MAGGVSGYTENHVHICAVCRRVLDLYQPAEGTPRYVHTGQDWEMDLFHEPQPIPAPANYREGRCDFCNEDRPEYMVPCRDFVVGLGHVSNGDWAACEKCVRFIEVNDWKGLRRRVMQVKSGRERRTLSGAELAALGQLFRMVRKNITGAPRKIIP